MGKDSGGGGGGGVSGYKYYMKVLMGLCRGPIDNLVAIKVNEVQAWSYITTGGLHSNRTVQIDQPNLFGGDDKEGGIQGPLEVYFGAPDQDIQSGGFVRAIGGLISDLRGVVTCFYDGLISSNSPYPKPWTFRVQRALKGWVDDTPWYPEEAVVLLNDGAGNEIRAMNPAHILWECLTNPIWGRGLPVDKLFEDSFTSAANTLCREQFGLCMAWSRASDLGDFMQQVINHIGGVIYLDRSTGLLTLKLLRADYDADDLPLFDYNSGLLQVTDDQTTAPDNSHSEVIVTWVDPFTNNKRQTRIQNLAGTQANQTVTSTKTDYPGLPTAELAARIASRDIALQAPGIKRYTLKMDRRGRKITPGSVFRINVPDRSISNMILRAGDITEGPITEATLSVTAVQDVFGLPETSYLAPPEHAWVAPNRLAAPVTVQRDDEVTYRDSVRLLTQAELNTVTDDLGEACTFAKQPTSMSTAFNLNTRGAGEDWVDHGVYGWTPNAVLDGDLGFYDLSMAITGNDRTDKLKFPCVGWIDDEIVAITAFDTVANTMTIERGTVDTLPQKHTADAVIWFPDGFMAIDGRAYVTGEEVDIALVTRTNTDILSKNDAPVSSVTIVGRQGRPYPPGNLQVNGNPFGNTTTALADMVLTWAHRDRLTESDNLLGHTEGSTGPEAGTTYTVNIYSFPAMALLRTTTGITGDTWTYDGTMETADGNPPKIWVELFSVRDTLPSYQKYGFTIKRIETGYGHGYGLSYGQA